VTETLQAALGGLTANKLRTGLTILRLIGVGSVIVLIAVGTDSSDAVPRQIDALGSNVLLVTNTPTLGGLRRAATSSTQLTPADANALQSQVEAPDVESVSPVVSANGVTLAYNTTTYSPASFIGTTPSYEQARSYTMAEGSWFSSADLQNHNRMLVVGPTVVSALFAGQDPVGATVQINGTGYQLFGVTAPKGIQRHGKSRTVRFGKV